MQWGGFKGIWRCAKRQQGAITLMYLYMFQNGSFLVYFIQIVTLIVTFNLAVY